MWKRLAAAAAVAVAACAAGPSGPSDTSDSARDARVREALQEALDGVRATAGFPGATAAVVLPDGTVIEVATGLADVETGVAMDVDHRLLAGSIGKTFVAAAAMALIEDGALAMDTPVAEVLADRAWYAEWPNAETITLANLLNHSSGVGTDYLEQPGFAAAIERTWTEGVDLADIGVSHDDFAAWVSGTPAAFAPGENFHYSDVSYTLAALMIEDVAGDSIEALVAARFLAPLGLDEIEPQTRDLAQVAAGYLPPPIQAAFGGAPAKAYADGRFAYDPEMEWGGGGWAATSGDLARWAQAWFSGRALDADYLSTVMGGLNRRTPPQLGDAYGPGMQLRDNGPDGESRFHGGYMLGYIAKAEHLPARDMSLALMINTVDPRYEAYQQTLWAAVLAALDAGPP